MSKAATIVRHAGRESLDYARLAIVLICAGALILAGEVFPFTF